jgi:hypothetical protein
MGTGKKGGESLMNRNMDLNGRVVYQYCPINADYTAIVTGSFFENEPGTSYQVQVADLDVGLTADISFDRAMLFPTDVGALIVNAVARDLFESMGCSGDWFRAMTVNGRPLLLWQLCAPVSYDLVNLDIPPSCDGEFFRGPIEDIVPELLPLQDVPVGCIKGREDYQDLFFRDDCYSRLSEELENLTIFKRVPLYSEAFLSALGRNSTMRCSDEEMVVFCSSEFLGLLSSNCLLELLASSRCVDLPECFDAVYKFIQKADILFSVKKKALMLKKSRRG